MKTLTDKTFAQEVEQASGRYIVEFSGYYCGACRSLRGALAKIAAQEGVPFAEVDATEAPRTARRYKIEKVPTTIMFTDGKETQRQVGPVNIHKSMNRPE